MRAKEYEREAERNREMQDEMRDGSKGHRDSLTEAGARPIARVPNTLDVNQ